MKQLSSFLILISCWLGAAFGQTTHDVEYAQICLIDSIAPDTMNQFWRLTAANNPGEYTVDMTWDMTSSYSVSGTVVPCCSCLTEATAMAGPGGWGDIAASNPAPINALLLFSGLVFVALLIPPLKIPVRKIGAILAILAFPLALSAQPGQAGTVYDIEYSCICLVDSIAADTINQFWRFTQANNPGEYTVDVTYDFASAYTPSGVLLSCKDYYLGDNPGGSGTANTLTMWTGPSSLGNSSVTQSGQILSSSFTGAFKLPLGTNAQEPVWANGMVRYDSDDAAFEGYAGSKFFLAEAATNNLTSNSVLIADANGRISQDNANFYYASDILNLGTTSILRIDPVSGASNSSVFIGSSDTQFGSSAVAIGWSAESDGSSGIAIGNTTEANQSGTAIGNSANAGDYATAIGQSAIANVSTAIAIGAATVTGSGGISIGESSSVSGQAALAIGNNADATNYSTAVGRNTNTGHNGSIAIGNGSRSTATNQFVAGATPGGGGSGEYWEVTDVYFGSGVQRGNHDAASTTGAGSSYAINGSGAGGTDQNGGNITIAGGKGTGSGTPGTVIFSTSTAGASSSTLQTLTERARINSDGRLGIGTTTPDSEFEVVGKAKITSLPDSLFTYEVRADANGRLARQTGSYVGTISTSTDASGDITIAHGMGTTPTFICVQPTGSPWTTSIQSQDATNFTVRFYLAGIAVVSGAVTGMWYTKK